MVWSILRDAGLAASLSSGHYPEFLGICGPSHDLSPKDSNPFDFLSLLWPTSLCALIAIETNRYACQKGAPNWHDTVAPEIWTFLGIILLMGIKRLPRIQLYWGGDDFVSVPTLARYMSRTRFWAIWRYLHVTQGECPAREGLSNKIKPVIDTLSHTFLQYYSPGQELSVDEAMVKYKGHVGGKVCMPRKPVKLGFKIWCCSCSCCGYLCTFQVYHGASRDLVTGRKVPERGLAKRVVGNLVAPFVGVNHVLYCDNFYSSGPLVDSLARDRIFFVGTIKKNAKGFPAVLKNAKLPKGSYLSETVDGKSSFVFHDRREVCFVTNVFPEHMDTPVARLQPEGVLRHQSVPPLLPAYNKFMGGVDRTDQLRKTYGFDRKSKRYWLRLFFQYFDYAVNNAYLLYKHGYNTHNVCAKDSLGFRLELVHVLLKVVGSKPGTGVQKDTKRNAQSEQLCELERLAKIGLKRGRCRHCQLTKKAPVHSTSFGCTVCRVRLCKTPSPVLGNFIGIQLNWFY